MSPWAEVLGWAAPARADGSAGRASATGAASALRVAVSLAVVVIVFAVDVRTGSELSVSFFYLLPVAFVTWTMGTWPGVAFAALCSLGWFAAYALDSAAAPHPPIMAWNALLEAAVFVSVALILARARSGRERERTLFVALDRELRSVGDLQRSLLPAGPPRIPGYAFGTYYATSTRAGGDYFDFIALPEGRLAVTVADASGHGSPAALLMGMTRILFRVSAGAGASPGEILSRVQSGLGGNSPPGQFVTACVAVLDPRDGGIELALAGHPYPLVARRSSREVESLETSDGLPLGLDRPSAYPVCRARLAQGDVLVLYTDGITEASRADGEMYGTDRLRAFLSDALDRPADVLGRELAADAARFCGRDRPEDDVTIVVVQRLAS